MERSAGTGVSLGASNADSAASDTYEKYVAKFGKDNADYLMEVMGAWQSHYQRSVFINLGVGDSAAVEAKTKEQAARRGWTFERMSGDLVLIRRLLMGDWERDFLVIEPGQEIAMTYDEEVMGCLLRG
jgi:hypothetical protein